MHFICHQYFGLMKNTINLTHFMQFCNALCKHCRCRLFSPIACGFLYAMKSILNICVKCVMKHLTYVENILLYRMGSARRSLMNSLKTAIICIQIYSCLYYDPIIGEWGPRSAWVTGNGSIFGLVVHNVMETNRSS